MAGTASRIAVNHTYGEEEIVITTVQLQDTENYKLNYEKSLKGLENFLHEHLVP